MGETEGQARRTHHPCWPGETAELEMAPGRRKEFASLLGDDADEFGAGGDSVYRGPPWAGGSVERDEEPH